MDEPPDTAPPGKPATYTTSKQVQAWFLGRSRDRWKKKYADLKVQTKRLKQHVADACRSRADWRGKAEAAQREIQALRAQIDELQARLDAHAEPTEKKLGWQTRLERPDFQNIPGRFLCAVTEK